jgi:hypothetical protein
MTERGKQRPVCDICGKPATMQARDVIRDEQLVSREVKVSPVGGVRYGCRKHPVASEVHHRRSLQ